MSWEEVSRGLEAAKKAGLRLPPGPLPDYIYANRAWLNKRLYGRSISLVGEVRSKMGKSDFICSNGHTWKTVPTLVAEGHGCPICMVGQRTIGEMSKVCNARTLRLLVNYDRPGFVRLSLFFESDYLGGKVNEIPVEWHEHRYRKVEEPQMAESIMLELLGAPDAGPSEEIRIKLKEAEKAFRQIHYKLESEIAQLERAKEELAKID